MPSTLLIAATDIIALAGAAAVATAALNSKKVLFRTTLGAEHEDDSLLGSETNNAIGTSQRPASPLQKHADDGSKAPTVTVTEVAVTPPAAELQKDDFFADAKAA